MIMITMAPMMDSSQCEVQVETKQKRIHPNVNQYV
jgi:hypothetical protein